MVILPASFAFSHVIMCTTIQTNVMKLIKTDVLIQNAHDKDERGALGTMDTYGHLYKDRGGAIGEHLQNMHDAAEASKEKEDGGDGKGTGNLTEK